MAENWTPGNWELYIPPTRRESPLILDSRNRNIAGIYGRDSRAEEIANARLLAAARDLYAALKAHDEYMADAGYSGPDDKALHPKAAENWRRIRAVMAKARGEAREEREAEHG